MMETATIIRFLLPKTFFSSCRSWTFWKQKGHPLPLRPIVLSELIPLLRHQIEPSVQITSLVSRMATCGIWPHMLSTGMRVGGSVQWILYTMFPLTQPFSYSSSLGIDLASETGNESGTVSSHVHYTGLPTFSPLTGPYTVNTGKPRGNHTGYPVIWHRGRNMFCNFIYEQGTQTERDTTYTLNNYEAVKFNKRDQCLEQTSDLFTARVVLQDSQKFLKRCTAISVAILYGDNVPCFTVQLRLRLDLGDNFCHLRRAKNDVYW